MLNLFRKFFVKSKEKNRIAKITEKILKTNFSPKATVKMLKYFANKKNKSNFECHKAEHFFLNDDEYSSLLIEVCRSCGNHDSVGNYKRFVFSVKSMTEETETQVVYFIPDIEYSTPAEVVFSKNKIIKKKLPLRIGNNIVTLYNKVSAKS